MPSVFSEGMNRRLRGWRGFRKRFRGKIKEPNSKIQTPDKNQAPGSKQPRVKPQWAFLNAERRTQSAEHGTLFLELGVWSFSGAWCLDLGSFERCQRDAGGTLYAGSPLPGGSGEEFTQSNWRTSRPRQRQRLRWITMLPPAMACEIEPSMLSGLLVTLS
jgi:hypothetical protein